MAKREKVLYTNFQMANLSKEDILKLARLSRLKLTDEEVEQFAQEIPAILGYVEQLQSVDLEGLAATNQVTGLVNVSREDIVRPYGATPELLLNNAPAVENNQIKVKRMIA